MLRKGDLNQPEMAQPADIQKGPMDIIQKSQDVPSERPWPRCQTAVASVGSPLLEMRLQKRQNFQWQQHFTSVEVLQITVQSETLS